MNWRKIDEAWRSFAANNNWDLQFDEKPYLAGVKVNYRINFTDNLGKTIYSGFINKSTSGYNLYKMDVETELFNGLISEEIEVKRKNRIAQIFRLSNSSESMFNQQIEKCLARINAVKIIMGPKILKMEFDFMPTNLEQLNLIEKVRIELTREKPASNIRQPSP